MTRAAAIERALAAPLRTVSDVSVKAASAQRPTKGADGGAHIQAQAQVASEQQRLSVALAQLLAQAGHLRALPAPPAAAHLRSMLLSLTGAEIELTRQVSELIAFVPSFSAAIAPLGSQLKALERALSANGARGTAAVTASYRAKAGALGRFQRAADSVVAALSPLHPPAASRPAYLAQLASLRGMAASAGRLAAALRRSAPGDLRPLLIDFDRAAIHPRALSVQRAQVAAVRAYDAAVARLSSLSSRIATERYRLATRFR